MKKLSTIKFICRGTALLRFDNGLAGNMQMRSWTIKQLTRDVIRKGINQGGFKGKKIKVEKANVFVYVVDKDGGEHFVKKQIFDFNSTDKQQTLSDMDLA